MSVKEKTTLFLIFALALGLRLGYTVFLRQHYPFYNNPSSDVYYYQQWADSIARGDWSAVTRLQGLPLYPLTLALLKRLTLNHAGLIRFLHLLLGSLNCVLVYFIGRALFTKRVAGLAAGLTAVNLPLIYYDWLMMPVPFIIALSLLLVLALVQEEKISRKREWFMVGLLAGWLVLGDGKVFLFLILLCLSVLCGRSWAKKKEQLLRLGPVFLGVAVILGALTLYYKRTSGEWVFISSKSGFSFYAGNHQQAQGYYVHPLSLRASHHAQDEDQKRIAEQNMKRPLKQTEVSQYWTRLAFKYIQENPLDYLVLLGKKCRLFFTDTEKAHDLDLLMQKQWVRRWDINPFAVLFPLALWGMFLALRSRERTLPLVLLVVSQWLFTLIYYLTSRHRVSIYPALFLFQAFALDCFVRDIYRRQYKNLTVPAGFFLLYLFLFPPQKEDPRYLDYLYSLKMGQKHELLKEYPEARQFYSRAVRLHPQNADAWFSLGNVCLLDRQYAQAQRYYWRALKINALHTDALYNLGFAYEKDAKPEKARQCYAVILQTDPESVDVHYRIAQVLQQQGQCAAALRHMKIVVRARPDMRPEFTEMLQNCNGIGGEE